MKIVRSTRVLGKRLKKEIYQIKPDNIFFLLAPEKRFTVCYMKKGDSIYLGVAICSVLDKFGELLGMERAAGRAIKAYKGKKASESIRKHLSDFPGGWTIAQAKNVAEQPFLCKSYIVAANEFDFDAFCERIKLGYAELKEV